MIICSQCGNIIEENLSSCSDCGAEAPIAFGNPLTPVTGNPYSASSPLTTAQNPTFASVQPPPTRTAPDLPAQPQAAPADGGKPIALFAAIGAVGLVVVVVLVYFVAFSFSARKAVLAQVKTGSLVKPQGNSAYDLFLRYRNSDLSKDDIAEITNQVAPLLEKRGEEILQNLRNEQTESEDDWMEAARIYSWLNELRPNKPFEARLYFAQGRIEFLKKNYNGSIKSFGRAVELVAQGDASSAPALNSIARAYLAMKDKGSAMDYYQRATKAEPGWLWPWVNLGALAIDEKIKDYVTAENALRHAIELNNEKASSHYLLGATLEKTNRQGKALCEYRIALNSATNNPTPTVNLDTLRSKISALESSGIQCAD
jgi:tetratricopeptide (TPR) repeat protein